MTHDEKRSENRSRRILTAVETSATVGVQARRSGPGSSRARRRLSYRAPRVRSFDPRMLGVTGAAMTARTTYNELTADELAEQAAEAIRGLNHLTRDAGSLRTPAEAYRVLSALSAATERLPQTLQQLDALLQLWTEQGVVSIDDGEFIGDPEAAAATVSVHLLEEARPALEAAGRGLAAAQQAIAFASFTGEDEF